MGKSKLSLFLGGSLALSACAPAPPPIACVESFQPSAPLASRPIAPADSSYSKILFLMRQGNVEEAIARYREMEKKRGSPDYGLLRNLAEVILDQGSEQIGAVEQVLTTYGAGISGDPQFLGILKKSLQSPDPRVQMTAVSLLSNFNDGDADRALLQAMSSPYLGTRFEAAYAMAEKKLPSAVGQIAALCDKILPEIKPLFPPLLALEGSSRALTLLRQQLSDEDIQVRLSAILSAAQNGRDELLPDMRRLLMQVDIAQQEACCVAVGILGDKESIPRLRTLANSGPSTVSLAAQAALCKMGIRDYQEEIERKARAGDIFAISVLGTLPGSEDVLADLKEDADLSVRINAVASLVRRGDPRCLPEIEEILVRDTRSLNFAPKYSLGRGLKAWDVLRNLPRDQMQAAFSYETSLHLREMLLQDAMALPEWAFTALAEHLFETYQRDLIPCLAALLEHRNSPEAVDLLKEQQQKAGAPFIRAFCNLALYRMGEAGPWAEDLAASLAEQQGNSLIRFRPVMPLELRDPADSFTSLTPEEVSRLMLESFQALANAKEEKAVDLLLDSIAEGHPSNRFVLAGLLIRATE